jgi:acetyl-CoA acyltransferase
MANQAVYIVAAKRTPVGKIRGQLASVRPDDLMAHTIRAVMSEKAMVDPALIDDVIVGCAMPEGTQGMNVARIATLLSGLPVSVPAMTVNRFCASGLQAVALAAARIQTGDAELVLAGGTESMSQVPMGGFQYSVNPSIFHDENLGIAYGMGLTAEKVANKWEISREAQDQYALESHRRAIEAQQTGVFKSEIATMTVTVSKYHLEKNTVQTNQVQIESDQGPRKDCREEALARLKPVFAKSGSITAGNTSQMSDGAACLMLASEAMISRFDLTPLARFVGFEVVGLEPELMGVGPIYAIPKLLKKCQLSLDQIDWIELNEAFAAQTLAVSNALSLDIAKVNPYGGAIALGHPLGATGAIRTTTLLHALRKQHLKYGIVTMCIGTGMGAAGLFEAV